MNILVTGGGGFIGSALIRRLVEMKFNVSSLSRNVYKEHASIGVTSIKADLCDYSLVEKACEGIDIVFHIAAKVGIWGNYDDFYRVNVIGTNNLLKACKKQKVKKFIYTSSASVVFDGNCIEGGDESLPYPEKPISSYTATKALAEIAVLSEHSENFKTISLRPHIVWGPGDTNIIPGIISRAEKGKLWLIGSGKEKMDITYIDNLVDAHINAIECLKLNYNVGGKSYFISDGVPVNIHHFINSILLSAGLEPVKRSISRYLALLIACLCEFYNKILKIDAEPPLTRFIVKELSSSHWFDISAARNDLKYQPRVNFDEGLKKLF